MNVERLSSKALALKPSRVLVAVTMAPFAFVGWVLGLVWLLAAYPIAAVMDGWQTAANQVQRWRVEARESENN